MKKITLINGNPNNQSLCETIAQAYKNDALKKGQVIQYVPIYDLNFDSNLKHGYAKRMEIEPDLLNALEAIKWADHLVFIHPIWWLGMPARMKGFFDRAFLPHIAFEHHTTGTIGLFSNKTARIIHTGGDLSEKMYQENYLSSGLIQLEKGILNYCGITVPYKNFIGPLNEMKKEDIEAKLAHIPTWVNEDISLL